MDIKKVFEELFNPENCIQVNRKIIKELGLEAAVILTYANDAFPYGVDPKDPVILFMQEPGKSLAIEKLTKSGYLVKRMDGETEECEYFITAKGRAKVRWG